MNQEKLVVAAFDFDGTITYRDSFIPFLVYAAGKWQFAKGLWQVVPCYLAFKCGRINNQAAKEEFIRVYLSGVSQAEIQRLGAGFAAEVLPKMIRPELAEKIRWHNSQGHQCVLISASLDVYLEPWARKMGFATVLSSRLSWNNQAFVTGCLKGNNCYGAEKAARLKKWLGTRKADFLYAYGDSRGDRELLALADEAYLKGKRQIVDNRFGM
ncbi:MAG: HAD-IB family hydrolase [Pelosinus sp.]|nr:HAD-IB family hydrolase [Pelosinus sp.]